MSDETTQDVLIDQLHKSGVVRAVRQMSKAEAKNKMAALFQKCWEAFDANDIGRGGPFDYMDWLEWADELGLVVVNQNDDGEGYVLADGVAKALPSVSNTPKGAE